MELEGVGEHTGVPVFTLAMSAVGDTDSSVIQETVQPRGQCLWTHDC